MKKYTRKEMKEKMEARGLSPNTIIAYVGHIHNLARFSDRPPHTLGPDDILRFQMHLIHERQVSYSYYNQATCAMSFFLPSSLKISCQSTIFHFRNDRRNFL
jgi:Phage integrase, N-terminal SAM-like domain